MKNYKVQSKTILLLTFVALLPLSVFADINGRVVSISDGDTVTILDKSNTQYKIRLAGIDAPEKKQPFGQRSKQSLSDCAYNKLALIEGNKTDRYGRLIGKVIVDGIDCNLNQINLGLAWHYKKYMQEQSPDDRLLYSQAEIEARNKNLGLWGDKNPIAPWDWRRK